MARANNGLLEIAPRNLVQNYVCHYTAEADLPASSFLTATATTTLNAIPSLQAFGNLRIDSQTSHAQV